jgi:hypothetical protein
LLKVALITINRPTIHVQSNLVVSNSRGPPENTRSYPRFDLSWIDYDVSCFIDKGSDVCFHHVWKCVKYIFDCHVYRLRFVRYVLDVFVFFDERINKEISIHKTFIYYSMNLIFNKNECELFKRNKKNDILNYYQSRFQ